MDRRTPFARADAPGRSRTSGEAGQPGGRAADLQRLLGNRALAELVQRTPEDDATRPSSTSADLLAPDIDVGTAREQFEAGSASYGNGDFAAARSHFLSAYLAAPTAKRPTLAFNVGQACRRGGLHAEAISWYQEYLADAGTRAGDARDALHESRLALASAGGDEIERGEAPDDEVAQREFEAGSNAYGDGDFETARSHFMRSYATATPEKRGDLAFTLGQTQRRLGRHATAISFYEEYISTGDTDRLDDAREGIRLCRVELGGDTGIAVPDQADDDAARVAFEAGSEAYERGEYEVARRSFLRGYAVGTRPRQAAFAFTLGQTNRRLQRWDEAIGFYREYLLTGDGARDDDTRDGLRQCRNAIAVGAGEDIERPEAATAATPGQARPILSEGASGDDVIHLQRRLNTRRVGSDGTALPVTGEFDAVTFARVVILQETFGLRVDGDVGDDTWAALESDAPFAGATVNGPPATITEHRPRLQRGAIMPAVGRLQAALNASGRIPTPELVVDDIFGPRTRSRVILFQLVGGLEPTGIVDTDTWTLLDDVLHS